MTDPATDLATTRQLVLRIGQGPAPAAEKKGAKEKVPGRSLPRVVAAGMLWKDIEQGNQPSTPVPAPSGVVRWPDREFPDWQ